MTINRHRFIDSHSPAIITPIIIPDISTPPIVQAYILSDFGENAINNHTQGVESHSARNQEIFNYVTRNFRNRCISYESYKTQPYNGFVWDELESCKMLKADIIYTPYVDAARWTNTDNNNFILTVGSHYDNDGQYDNHVGSDNNRHDITINSTTFLSDSIAVSARRDTPELFKNSTSEGYGMEFFEDCSKEGLDIDYPNADVPIARAWVTTNEDGTVISTEQSNAMLFANDLSIGDEVTIRYSDHNETRVVSEVLSPSSYRVAIGYTPISTPAMYYCWKDGTLGEYMYGQAESWAVPLVAGKLKVIKMTTNSDWDAVRAAARATARRNPTGIPEIDNTNWDIYRGFGQIDVQAAINYINNNA